MKLLISDIAITLGGGVPYFLDVNPVGLSGELTNINVQIPGTDFSQNIADYLTPGKTRVFGGTIVGRNQTDFRDKKRYLANILRQTYTFNLIDDYINSDGSTTIYATYRFIGKITLIDPNKNMRSNMSNITLNITSEDPLFYLLPDNIYTANIRPMGFTFPLVFPFVFASSDNTMIFTNPGITSYPIITITGPISNLQIINANSGLTNNVFQYYGTLNALDQLVITPITTDPVHARLNGVSVINLTNSNWPALYIYPGVNDFVFFGNGGVIGQTQAVIDYNSAFIGI